MYVKKKVIETCRQISVQYLEVILGKYFTLIEKNQVFQLAINNSVFPTFSPKIAYVFLFINKYTQVFLYKLPSSNNAT